MNLSEKQVRYFEQHITSFEQQAILITRAKCDPTLCHTTPNASFIYKTTLNNQDQYRPILTLNHSEVITLELNTPLGSHFYHKTKTNMTLDQIIAIHKELRYEEALSAYEAYLDNNQDPHAKELYAIALAQSHHYEKALSIFKELYRQHPKRYSLLNHIALCHKHLGKLDLAQKHLKQSIKIQPYATTYNNLASIYLSQRDFIQAAILLQKHSCYTLNIKTPGLI